MSRKNWSTLIKDHVEKSDEDVAQSLTKRMRGLRMVRERWRSLKRKENYPIVAVLLMGNLAPLLPQLLSKLHPLLKN